MLELRLDGSTYRGQRPRRGARLVLAFVASAVVVGALVAVLFLSDGSSSKASLANNASAHQPAAASSPRGNAAPAQAAVAKAPLPKLIGQLLIGSFKGVTPPASILSRIRAGRLGSVILFSDNTAGGLTATRAAVARLQSAAKQGGNPPLLIMTDQEGGEVRRLPGPPTMNAAQMTSTVVARSQGVQTGRLLRSVGVNVDLAPVSDVTGPSGSFLGPRSFSTDPQVVGARACAFASGLASTGVGYTLKHFPGLGLAAKSTDLVPVTIGASAATLEGDWDAYRLCGSNARALVMVSNAIYPKLTGPLPAVESPRTYSKALPSAVNGRVPVTVSDDLEAGALKNQASPALHALGAGLDIAMYASTEDGSALAYTKLLSDARTGLIPRARIMQAEQAVLGLKQAVAG